jgi:hypothetical protein
MPWADERLTGRIRFKLLQLDAGAEEIPRYYLFDLQAFLMMPVMRRSVEFVPLFNVPANPQNTCHRPTPAESAPVSPLCRIEAAALFLDLSRDSIEDRMVEWQDTPVEYRIRSSRSELKIGQNFARLCYRPDVEDLLKIPVPKKSTRPASRFHDG